MYVIYTYVGYAFVYDCMCVHYVCMYVCNNNDNNYNNKIQFLETHNTIKIVSMRVKSKYWTEIMKFQK